MKKLLGLIFASFLVMSAAHADFTAKDASGSTITFKNSGTCTSVVCVVQQQPVDSTGAAFGVTGNPFFMSFGTGVTLPAFGATPTVILGTFAGELIPPNNLRLGRAATAPTVFLTVQGMACITLMLTQFSG